MAARAYQRAQAVVQPGLGRKDAVPAARDGGGQVRPHGRLARVQDAKQGRIDRGLSGDLGGACARNGPDARTNKARVSVRSCGSRRSLARGPASWASLVPACECVDEALGLVVAVEAERRDKLFDLGRRLGRLRGEARRGRRGRGRWREHA